MTELEMLRSELATALAPIHDELETIKNLIGGIPLMGAHLKELRRDVRELRRETRMNSAAINDIARENVTAGEVAALHEELDKISDAQMDIRARLTLLEEKPGEA